MKKKEEVFYSRALVPKYNTIYKIVISILIIIIILLVGIYLGFIQLKKNEVEEVNNTETLINTIDVNELIFNDKLIILITVHLPCLILRLELKK